MTKIYEIMNSEKEQYNLSAMLILNEISKLYYDSIIDDITNFIDFSNKTV